MTVKFKAKNYKCTHCERETYSLYEVCLNCGSVDTLARIEHGNHDERRETAILRYRLHKAVDEMTEEELQRLKRTLFG